MYAGIFATSLLAYKLSKFSAEGELEETNWFDNIEFETSLKKESPQDIIDALNQKDLMLKTELETTHKKTVEKLANLSDESIDEIKGEDQEQEIIERGGVEFRKVNLIRVG